jgi:hypothetical protein
LIDSHGNQLRASLASANAFQVAVNDKQSTSSGAFGTKAARETEPILRNRDVRFTPANHLPLPVGPHGGGG